MKKRNKTQSVRLFRFCISLILAVILLAVYRSTSKNLDLLNVTGISPAAADVRVQFQKSESQDMLAKWDNGVWVPVVLAPGDSPLNSAAAVLQIRDLQSGTELYVCSPTKAQNYEPLPGVLYGLLMLAFGVTGFFSITPLNQRVNFKTIFQRRRQG